MTTEHAKTNAAIAARARAARDDAEHKAIDSLGRYKFEMFGYWASKWVGLNQLIGDKRANPFRELVHLARSSADAELRAADDCGCTDFKSWMHINRCLQI